MWTVRGVMAWAFAVFTDHLLIVFEQTAIEDVVPRAFAYLARSRTLRACRAR